jgi:hypothetical protein
MLHRAHGPRGPASGAGGRTAQQRLAARARRKVDILPRAALLSTVEPLCNSTVSRFTGRDVPMCRRKEGAGVLENEK